LKRKMKQYDRDPQQQNGPSELDDDQIIMPHQDPACDLLKEIGHQMQSADSASVNPVPNC
jgi:hypothetical protein